MTQNKHIRKSRLSLLPHRSTSKIGLGVVAAIIILQGSFDFFMYRWNTPDHDSTTIAGLLVTAINNNNKSAIIEPVSKRVYLPDANLVLPPYPTDVGEIRYSYTPPSDGTDAEASITTKAAMTYGVSKIMIAASNTSLWKSNSSAVFASVPNAQRCTRGLHVVFGSHDAYQDKLFSKQLADGRTMNVYRENVSCSFSLTPLVTYLKQADSY